MSNITQFFPGGGSGGSPGRPIRRIYINPGPYTFIAPPNGTSVEINCWGGGGSGSTEGGAGGGGAYVRYIYPISGGETFALTVGAAGGTTSASCPSQTPSSPISAGGGNSGSTTVPGPNVPENNFPVAGGSGGTAAATIDPSKPQYGLILSDGGAGGDGSYATAPPYPQNYEYRGGGGGSAGSFFGDGGDGAIWNAGPNATYGGGGSIFRPATSESGASGKFVGISTTFDLDFYYVEEMLNGGNGGDGGIEPIPLGGPADATPGTFLGGGGGGYRRMHPNNAVRALLNAGDGETGGGGGGYAGIGGQGLIILYHD